jgi:hypothetical protein
VAEREGFEPPDPCGSTVFKTAAFDRSATSPRFLNQPLTKPLLGRGRAYAAYMQPLMAASACSAIIAARA